MSKKINKIHFAGIGGSAISGISILAKQAGFSVSGCDMAQGTDYLDEVYKAGIEVFHEHSKEHLNDADLVVVSPALLYLNNDHPEVEGARRAGKLVTWEEFVSKYLAKDREVICISGTHGKSTTTAMCGMVFEKAGLDPLVIIGAKVREWSGNFRSGNGKYLILEADEFNDNFLNYDPSVIVINNIEMDHADYFADESQVFTSFRKFIEKLTKGKKLILNLDDPGVTKLLGSLEEKFLKSLEIYGYSISENPDPSDGKILECEITKSDPSGSEFSVKGFINSVFKINIPGKFNVSNVLGVIAVAGIAGISPEIIDSALQKFSGIGRRLELIGEFNGIKVYDDYAHHPTAIKATIEALRQKYPAARIWAIDEPHSYSRTKALLGKYKNAFTMADTVIIAPIYKARDKEEFGVSGDLLVSSIEHKDVKFLPSFSEIVDEVGKNSTKGDIILVMGAGMSYKLSRDIFDHIRNVKKDEGSLK